MKLIRIVAMILAAMMLLTGSALATSPYPIENTRIIQWAESVTGCPFSEAVPVTIEPQTCGTLAFIMCDSLGVGFGDGRMYAFRYPKLGQTIGPDGSYTKIDIGECFRLAGLLMEDFRANSSTYCTEAVTMMATITQDVNVLTQGNISILSGDSNSQYFFFCNLLTGDYKMLSKLNK